MAWLRGFALFALLVAVPLLLEQLLGKHPMVRHSFWENLPSYSGFGLLAFLLFVLPLFIFLFIYLPQTYQIEDWLWLAEREMNFLLRAWGGGFGNRKEHVKERADWLTMIPVTDDPAPFADVYKNFFDLNQDDLKSGGSQGTAMSKVRMTAFLLREIYQGRVKNAQLKIFNEVATGGKPYIAPGIRQIVGYDRFDANDVKNNGFPPDAGVDWFPLWLTVKLNRFPRDIVLIRANKSTARNLDAIAELTIPVPTPADEQPVPVRWLRRLESDDSPLRFFLRWLAWLIVFALAVFALLYYLKLI
jgi:hypothetical protein